MTVAIDLKDLAKADMSQLADLGACSYTAPCVIGLLMTPDQREKAENADLDDTTIVNLVHNEVVNLPEGQLDDAQAMQRAFDYGERETLATLVAKYGAKL